MPPEWNVACGRPAAAARHPRSSTTTWASLVSTTASTCRLGRWLRPARLNHRWSRAGLHHEPIVACVSDIAGQSGTAPDGAWGGQALARGMGAALAPEAECYRATYARLIALGDMQSAEIAGDIPLSWANASDAANRATSGLGSRLHGQAAGKEAESHGQGVLFTDLLVEFVLSYIIFTVIYALCPGDSVDSFVSPAFASEFRGSHRTTTLPARIPTRQPPDEAALRGFGPGLRPACKQRTGAAHHSAKLDLLRRPCA